MFADGALVVDDGTQVLPILAEQVLVAVGDKDSDCTPHEEEVEHQKMMESRVPVHIPQKCRISKVLRLHSYWK